MADMVIVDSDANIAVCRMCGKVLDANNKMEYRIIRGTIIFKECFKKMSEKRGCGC